MSPAADGCAWGGAPPARPGGLRGLRASGPRRPSTSFFSQALFLFFSEGEKQTLRIGDAKSSRGGSAQALEKICMFSSLKLNFSKGNLLFLPDFPVRFQANKSPKFSRPYRAG